MGCICLPSSDCSHTMSAAIADKYTSLPSFAAKSNLRKYFFKNSIKQIILSTSFPTIGDVSCWLAIICRRGIHVAVSTHICRRRRRRWRPVTAVAAGATSSSVNPLCQVSHSHSKKQTHLWHIHCGNCTSTAYEDACQLFNIFSLAKRQLHCISKKYATLLWE